MRGLHDLLLSPISTWFAVAVLVLSFLLPTEGLGVDLCVFHRVSGLPCPGCGLTRSVTCVSHLRLGDALAHHPFGLLVWPLVAALAAFALVPEAGRARVRSFLATREVGGRKVYLALVYAFVAFGLARLAVAMVAPEALAGP